MITPLIQPTTFAGVSERVEDEIERAYWSYDDRKTRGDSDRDAFKWAVREMFQRIRKARSIQQEAS